MVRSSYDRIKIDFSRNWQKRSFRFKLIILVILFIASMCLLISVGYCSRHVSRSEYMGAFNSLRPNMTREEVHTHLTDFAVRTRSREEYDIYEGIPIGEGYCGCLPVMTDYYKIEYKNNRVINVMLESDTGGWPRQKQKRLVKHP
jgi:hypothetical protein